jgi:hypothetical protein
MAYMCPKVQPQENITNNVNAGGIKCHIGLATPQPSRDKPQC